MFRKLSIAILAFSAIVTAEITLGLDMWYRVYNYENERESASGTSDQEQENGNTNFSLTPVLGICPNAVVEISPFFGYHFSSNKSKSKSSGSTQTSKSETSQHGIEPGFGIYFHLVNNSDILDFSLGPKISYRINFPPDLDNSSIDYDTYHDGVLAIACQINIDLHFNQHFAARLSSSLYRFSVNYYKEELENSDITTSRVTTNSDLRTILSPSLGFYFTF